jgi:hypothetical protein
MYTPRETPDYIVKGREIHFRQSFPLPVIRSLFTSLWELGFEIRDGASRTFPNVVEMSESEFLSVIEMTQI